MAEFQHLPPGIHQGEMKMDSPGLHNPTDFYNAVRTGFVPACPLTNYFPSYPADLSAQLQPADLSASSAIENQNLQDCLGPPAKGPLPPSTPAVHHSLPPPIQTAPDIRAQQMAMQPPYRQPLSAADEELMKSYPIYKFSDECYDDEEDSESERSGEDNDKNEELEEPESPEPPPRPLPRLKEKVKKSKKKKKKKSSRSRKKSEDDDTPRCSRCTKFLSPEGDKNTFPMSSQEGLCVYCQKSDSVSDEQREESIRNSMCYLCEKAFGRPRNVMRHLRDVHREPDHRITCRDTDENQLKAFYYSKSTTI